MIYSNCFQILARSRNFLRPIIVLSQRTQRYATIPYLCVLFTLRKSSNFSAHRLSSFLPFSSTIQLFQLSDLLLRPIATQWTTRPTFDHRPSRTGHILSLARSYAAFSLSLSLSLSPSYTLRFVLPSHTHTQTCSDTLNDVRPFYSPRSVSLPALSSWFHSFAQKSNFHDDRGDMDDIDKGGKKRQCYNCRTTTTDD